MFEGTESQRLRARRYLLAGLVLLIAGLLGWLFVRWSTLGFIQPDHQLIFLKAVADDTYNFTETPCRITESPDPLAGVLQPDKPGQHDRIVVPVQAFEFALHRKQNLFTVYAYGAPRPGLPPVSNPTSKKVLASYGTWPFGDLSEVQSHRFSFLDTGLQLMWRHLDDPGTGAANLFFHVHGVISGWTAGGKPHEHHNPAPDLRKALTRNFQFLYFGTLVAALLGMISAAVSLTRLFKLYRQFSAIDLKRRLGLWRFLFSSDYMTLARQERKRLSTIRAEQERNREVQQQRQWLDNRLTELRVRFAERPEEWHLASRALEEDSPLSQKQEAVAILERRLSRQTAADTTASEEARQKKVQELIVLYRDLAAGEPDPQAQARFGQAMQTTDWKEKRDLLQEAIAIQRDAHRVRRKGAAERPIEEEPKPAEPEADMRYVRLLEMVDREFPDLTSYLPSKVSPLMVREIIVRFVNPGTDGSIFGSAYFSETNLKRGVDTRMRMRGLPFSPKEFWQALDWLVGQGVVLKHDKRSEPTYSLNPTTKGLTPNAAEIVKAVVNFSLKFKEPG